MVGDLSVGLSLRGTWTFHVSPRFEIQICLISRGGGGTPPRDVNVLIYILPWFLGLVGELGWGGSMMRMSSFSSFLGTVNVFIYIPFLAVFATQPTYYRTGIWTVVDNTATRS